MANRECVRCHRLFENTGLEQVCPTCLPTEEFEFSRIKEYLTLHPGASSSMVIHELKVSLKSIRRYLKEDRLEIIGENKGFLRCEICGVPISSGRFCELCYKEGQAMMRNEAGLGIKSAYIRPADHSKAPASKGIQYREKNDKKG